MARKPKGTTRRTAKRRYKLKVESDVYVTMRDGVRIALRIYRPDADGKYPALFAASPYMYDTDDLPHSPLFLWREVGPVDWYVEEHGYAYVHADVRGSGKSEGRFGLLDAAEQQDLHELIEWIARQAWCTGKVGGIGQSYYAWSQWFMGIVNPPHLACIAPYDGAVDMYRDSAYHGGIYCEFMTWWFNMVRVNNLHRAANNPGGKAMVDDIAYEMIAHQTYDSWWKERSAWERLGEIKVPVLSIGHWGKLGLHLRGNILGYEDMRAPRRLIVTGAKDVFEAHDLFDQIAFHESELLPFYDHYLKGVETGYANRAPVRLYVRGDEQFRDETEWPLERATTRRYFLRKGPSKSVTSLNDGALTPARPGRNEQGTSYTYPDPQWKLGIAKIGPFGPDPIARVLTYTTPALSEDIEVTGPIVLELYVSSTVKDAEFVIKLADQFPQDAGERRAGRQPSSVNVTKGWLRASHRKKDEQRSKPYRPIYEHRDPQPIERGTIYKLEIEVLPCSYVFRKGHRIRLEIVNGDCFFTDSLFTHQYLPYKVGRDTIWHNAANPSALVLPIVPRANRLKRKAATT